MIDILQELTYLSEGLQSRSISIGAADRLINRTIAALSMMKEKDGNFENNVQETIESELFTNIPFENITSARQQSLPRAQLKFIRA